MKNYRSFLIALAVILLPSWAFAESIFGPYDQDISIQYLGMIFNNVEGTDVTGPGFEVLKATLSSFNLAIMSLGAIVILYSILVSFVNTAHDGEMLGREWSSVWIPLRTAMGFALLLPVSGTGSYSVIQVFIMWVVTQGVYAADFLWEKSVDQLIGNPEAGKDYNPNNQQTYLLAQSIFVSLVCAKQAAIDLNSSVSNIGPSSDGKYSFGIQGYTPNDICGNVALTKIPVVGGGPPIYSPEENQAVAAMINELNPTANLFISKYNNNSDPSEYQQKIQSAINLAGNRYNKTMNDIANNNDGNYQELAGQLEKSKEVGWAMAGSTFLTMAKITNDNVSANYSVPDADTYLNITDSNGAVYISKFLSDYQSFATEMQLANSYSTPPDIADITSPDDITNYAEQQLNGVQDVFLKTIAWFASMFTADDASQIQSPVLTIMTAGIWITRIIVAAYAAITVATTIFGAAAYAAGNSVLGLAGAGLGWGALLTFLNFATTPLMILMGVFLSLGITWGFYVPLIPYIVFTMGVISWIMLVIEAMVAAPLMAIGVLHPEGKHTVFGEAHAGIMIIAGVFLRPALMVIGLIAALIMTYVVVTIISVGFMPVAASIAAAHYSIVGTIAMMVFYTMLILIGINKSFSMIHVLPDKVMRWIGQPGEQTDPGQELQELKGGAQAMEKPIADTPTTTASGVKSITDAGIEKRREKDKKNKDDDEKSKKGGGIQASQD